MSPLTIIPNSGRIFTLLRYLPNSQIFAMKWFQVFQIVTSVLLIISILLQQRGSGLGSAFGGEGNVYRARRGVERILFIGTIVLSVLFLGSGIASLLIK